MDILVAEKLVLDGIEQDVKKVEMLHALSSLTGEIKKSTKKSPAKVTIAVPDEWAQEIMMSVLGRKSSNYFLMRVEPK